MRVARSLRIRHYRGHGIHSPFAYGIARGICMHRRSLPRTGTVYSAVIKCGGSRREAGLVQALYAYAQCTECSIDGEPAVRPRDMQADGRALEVATGIAAAEAASPYAYVTCLLAPARNREWYRYCRTAAERHEGMGIDCRDALFLFRDNGLNREHLKL